jgi:hypothetical protein
VARTDRRDRVRVRRRVLDYRRHAVFPMIVRLRPRWLAQFLAYVGGYFWLPCPVCGELFAGFEASNESVGMQPPRLLTGAPELQAIPMWVMTGGKITCRRAACVGAGRRERHALGMFTLDETEGDN